MKYSDWKSLTNDERKNIRWHRRPHIRIATLYGAAFIIAFIIIVFGISKNSTVHINRKPTSREAFNIAKVIIRDKLKQPSTASFTDNSYTPVIDTATNSYQINSSVKFINEGGKTVSSTWELKMNYLGGDWSEKNSWKVQSVTLNPGQ